MSTRNSARGRRGNTHRAGRQPSWYTRTTVAGSVLALATTGQLLFSSPITSTLSATHPTPIRLALSTIGAGIQPAPVRPAAAESSGALVPTGNQVAAAQSTLQQILRQHGIDVSQAVGPAGTSQRAAAEAEAAEQSMDAASAQDLLNQAMGIRSSTGHSRAVTGATSEATLLATSADASTGLLTTTATGFTIHFFFTLTVDSKTGLTFIDPLGLMWVGNGADGAAGENGQNGGILWGNGGKGGDGTAAGMAGGKGGTGGIFLGDGGDGGKGGAGATGGDGGDVGFFSLIGSGGDGGAGGNGIAGVTGVNGVDGSKGAQGVAGAKGADGANGAAGANGLDGRDGVNTGTASSSTAANGSGTTTSTTSDGVLVLHGNPGDNGTLGAAGGDGVPVVITQKKDDSWLDDVLANPFLQNPLNPIWAAEIKLITSVLKTDDPTFAYGGAGGNGGDGVGTGAPAATAVTAGSP